MSKQLSVDQAFKEIDKQFDNVQKKNKYLKYALLTPIHDKYPYAQNGITAMIASMGSGKTYTYLKLMKQQEVLFDDAFYELIVLCSTSNKFDATVNAFKGLITKSKLVAIKDTDLLEFLNKYMRRILKFNALNKYMKNRKDVDEELERLSDKHQLKLNSNKPKDVEKVVKYVCNKIEKYQWQRNCRAGTCFERHGVRGFRIGSSRRGDNACKCARHDARNFFRSREEKVEGRGCDMSVCSGGA